MGSPNRAGIVQQTLLTQRPGSGYQAYQADGGRHALMKYPEEGHARALLAKLERKLRGISNPPAEISISGGGVHWRCEASRGDSSCRTSCFDIRGVPQLLVSFDRSGSTQAWGRTSTEREAVAAIADWLNECSVPELHHGHAFVDRSKRALAVIAAKSVALHPALLRSAPPVIKPGGSDINYLWFRSATRSCELSFWGDKPHPDAKFHWDECKLFEFPVSDISRLGAVLKRWLIDESPPSVMRAEFPWLEIGPLADYYEQGNPIEGEFLQSWERIERFYQERSFPHAAELKSFIAEMREQGFDRSLRAGQSMDTMVLSRARRHGLEEEHPWVSFSFQNGRISARHGTSEEDGAVEVPAIKLSPEIEDLLRWLESQPIT